MIDWRSAVALVWAIGGWFVAAVFLGASGAVHKSPLLLLGAMTVPIIVFLILCSFLSSLQQAMTALPTEVYVLANGARVLAGLYLIDSGTGLPSEWAVPAAGLGIAIGIVLDIADKAEREVKFLRRFDVRQEGFDVGRERRG